MAAPVTTTHRHTGSGGGHSRSNNDPSTPRSTSSPALPSISSPTPLHNQRDFNGGPTPSPSAPAGLSQPTVPGRTLPAQLPLHPVNYTEFLNLHNGDSRLALVSLIDDYNQLINSTSRSPEHLQLSKENLKLWNLCSTFKRDRDYLTRQISTMTNRMNEYESILRTNNIPIPPARSLSASPVDELNPPQPPPIRSLSDDPNSNVNGPGQANRPRERKVTGERLPNDYRRKLGGSTTPVLQPTPFIAVPMTTSLSNPSSVQSTLPHSTSMSSMKSSSKESPSPGHLSRKASSLDLGRRALPVVTSTSRSATPPPSSSSSTGEFNSILVTEGGLVHPLLKTSNSGTSTPPQDLPDEAKRFILASMTGTSLPLASPISPFFPSHQSNTSGNRSPASLNSAAPSTSLTTTNSYVSPIQEEATFTSPPGAGAPNDLGFIPPYAPLSEPHELSLKRPLPPTRIPSSPAKVPNASMNEKGKQKSIDSETRPSVSSETSEFLSQSRSSNTSGRRPPTSSLNHPYHHHSNSGGNRAHRPPTLTASLLPFVNVRVINSHIKPNERNREIVTFTISVHLELPDNQISTKWSVDKKWSDVLNLDTVVKNKHSKLQSRKIANLPDKSLFKDHAPSKVDLRKDVLQKYLQSLANVPLQDKSDICQFFNADVISERNIPIANPAYKAGYLTKKGRNFGGWQTRYYILQGPLLEYFESPGGSRLGHIDVTGAQIGRQQSSRDPVPNGDSYRHAFLIRESRREIVQKPAVKPTEDVDHILCAESDFERDEWVRVLAAWHTGEYIEDATGTAPRSVSSEPRTVRKAPNETNGFVPPQAAFGGHRREVSLGQGSVHSHTDEPNHIREVPRSRRGPPPDVGIPHSSSYPTDLENAGNHRSTSAQGHHSGRDGMGLPRPTSPEKGRKSEEPNSRTAKISGPTNAVPIGNVANFKSLTKPPRVDEERRNRVKSSFWTFAGRSTRSEEKRDTPQAHQPLASPVFGVPLQEAVATARIRDDFELPAVIYRCVEYLEAKGAELEEGIYRLNGSANLIKSLKDRFNHEGDVTLLASGEYYDPHAIAGLLKTFLRDLPVHVLTQELRGQFMQVTDLTQRKDKVNELGRLIALLPIANYTLLRFLTAHLIHIVQNEKVNKMTLRNVGIVFSPTLALPATLFSLLLTEFDIVFAMEGDQPAPAYITEPAGDSGSSPAPIIDSSSDAVERRPQADIKADRRKSRNSVLYENLGADKLLELKGVRLDPREEEESENDLSSPEEEENEDDRVDAIPIVAVGGPVDGEIESEKEAVMPKSPSEVPSTVSTKAKGLSINVDSAQAEVSLGQLSPRSPGGSQSPHMASPRLGLPRSPGLPASPKPPNPHYFHNSPHI